MSRPLTPSRRPIAPTFRDALRSLVSEGRVTDQKWHEQLAPLLDGLPRAASPEARTLLQVWASSRFEKDGEASRHLRDFLHSRGYPVPELRPEGVSSRALVEQISSGNVTEADRAFFRTARAMGRLDAQTLVAVVDSGFDLWHPALGPKGWVNPVEIPANGVDDDGNDKVDDSHGWDWVDWDNNLIRPDGDWHGTVCAAKAAQGTDQVRIIPLRALPSPQPYAIPQLVKALEYGIAKGAKVCSLSIPLDSPERVEAMQALMARHRDVLFVIAAGNDAADLSSYDPRAYLPASEAPNLIVAAASDADGRLAGFSNRGASATHAARGTDVMSAIPGGGYSTMGGTSVAAPDIANIAAKCQVLDPSLTPEELKALLAEATPKREDWAGKVQAGGVVDGASAYARVEQRSRARAAEVR